MIRNKVILSHGVLIACGLFAAACGGAELFLPAPSGYNVHGIDVARYQGQIDWSRVRDSGVAFAYIKATEGGDHLDEAFARNWQGAKRAGVPRGAYHFYYFCRAPHEQLSWFIENVPRDSLALAPVLDMEWNAHSKTCQRRPPKETVIAEMTVFLEGVERYYGKRPVIYTSVDFYRENLSDMFADYPFWVRSVAAPPEEHYAGRRWVFWQYSETGRIPGIQGDVDRNVFFGDRAQWTAYREGKSQPWIR